MQVLIIEDERRLARLMRRILEDECYVVDVALDGEAGLKKAGSGTYDLIVLDIMLPGCNGIEVCRWLRTQKDATPILMLTARGQLDDKVAGLDAGADDYLTKPFDFEELLARLRALARRPPASLQEPMLQVGDLTMDLTRHEVQRNGRPILLTVREFALLEYMIRHQGQVLSRAQITDHVWPYDHDAVSNIVDIYVHYLREKVDRGFATPLIHTIRGVGYNIRG
jgi:DNA-binding response OmpR family regulator